MWLFSETHLKPDEVFHFKFPLLQNRPLRPIGLLPTTGKLFEKIILKFVQKDIEERGMLNESQFGFRAHHSTILQ
jgi:hypothetical protein